MARERFTLIVLGDFTACLYVCLDTRGFLRHLRLTFLIIIGACDLLYDKAGELFCACPLMLHLTLVLSVVLTEKRQNVAVFFFNCYSAEFHRKRKR